MNIIGYIPIDDKGRPILNGSVRFKVYKTPAYAMASSGLAVGTSPVYIGEPS